MFPRAASSISIITASDPPAAHPAASALAYDFFDMSALPSQISVYSVAFALLSTSPLLPLLSLMMTVVFTIPITTMSATTT
jgi:hypothetical protein